MVGRVEREWLADASSYGRVTNKHKYGDYAKKIICKKLFIKKINRHIRLNCRSSKWNLRWWKERPVESRIAAEGMEKQLSVYHREF